MTLTDIQKHFENVKQTGGGIMARCPAHKDDKNSLSITEKDGKILLCCFAGCDTRDIVGAVGLQMKDLFITDPPQARRKKQIVATYDYTDVAGKLIATKIRYSDKSFLWKRKEAGKEVYNRKGIVTPLYNLPGIVNAEAVYLVEGEKDVNTLAHAGIAATTLPDGANSKWQPNFAEELQGKRIWIIPDNDDPGRKYAEECAKNFQSVAEKIKILDLRDIWPEIPKKGDIRDLVQTKGTAVLDKLPDLVERTAVWEPKKEKISIPANDTTLKPPDYSDAGNEEVFSRLHKDNLIYVDALGWLFWNGKRWQRDDHKAMELAKELSRNMLEEAQQQNREALRQQAEAIAACDESGDPEDAQKVEANKKSVKRAKAYLNHAQSLRNASKLRNVLDLSKSSLAVKADKLDADPFLLNTPAGIVDLRTGSMQPHSKEAYCSKITACSPEKQGGEMWYQFLDTISCKDYSLQGFLQMVSGMSLIGEVFQEGIVMAHGGGRNGKSTFFNALSEVLGDYSGGIDIKTLTTDRGNKGAALATLRGKRLVVTGELEEHQRLSIATLKQIASTDKLVIEEKYKQPETVKQSHTLVLFTNHLPRVGSADGGTWRRLLVVPFNATIPPGEGVQNYADVLVREAGGAILSWAIEGAVNFIKDGYRLQIPDAVAAATEEYRDREDWIKNFVSECCERGPEYRVQSKDLYSAYKAWAEEAGEYVRRQRDFSTAMETAGYRKIKPQNKATYLGLKLEIKSVNRRVG